MIIKRLYFAEKRLERLFIEANRHPKDARIQSQLLEELLKQRQYSQVIQRFEKQPQLSSISSSYTESQKQADVKKLQLDRSSLGAYVTALSENGSASRIADLPLIKAASHSSETSSSNHPLTMSTTGEPVPVMLVEPPFSFLRLLRRYGSIVIGSFLVVTGLSVLIDQQGMGKSDFMSNSYQASKELPTITFKDVEGVDEAKAELEEIVGYLREPRKYAEVGGKLPKGILLYGPPGTGKTHLARAIAGEAGVPFFHMSGSEFDELFVGVGAKRVRELFASARQVAPCIIFIDEIDALGSKRQSMDFRAMRQSLNQLLTELDGFSSSEGVIFIAATNTPEALDKALTRPGRIDRQIPVPLPDIKGRHKILKIHTRKVKLEPEVDLETIARGTPGFSGADLANLVNQSAIRATKENVHRVRLQDLEWAKDKIIMGSERKSAVITEESKRLTAYHEAGHTLIALLTQGAMPLHKVSVIPRGAALGVTVQLPENDMQNLTKRELLAMIDVCFGGRAAEELIFGEDEVTTGASNDLEKATIIAKDMIAKYGMSVKNGLLTLAAGDDLKNMSSESKSMLENEVREMLHTSYRRCVSLLQKHKQDLIKIAEALIEFETLSKEEIQELLSGKKLKKL